MKGDQGIKQQTNPRIQNLAAGLCALAISNEALAVVETGANSAAWWNGVIIFVVFSAIAGSAVLNIAAIRQWNRNWGLVSGLPIAVLALWSLFILVAKFQDPETHALWTLEIFAWAMINMIYMVTAMTAKRMFAKRDDEGAASL